MDNPDQADQRAALTWAPPASAVGLTWLLAVAAVVWVVLTDDVPGRVLLSVVALVLVAAALFGSLARPRLAADRTGVTVRGLTRRRTWGWGEVNVRLAHTRRLGREVATVEVDADPDLVVLGWLDLGADPVDVVAAIRELRT
ncbi:MAG: PH domain-containing protein [Labedaea sp.]